MPNVDIFGTLGPSCSNKNILRKMFEAGMTGIRINLSHTMLKDNIDYITAIKEASKDAGIAPKILIDLQGPELRIGSLSVDTELKEGNIFKLGIHSDIPTDEKIVKAMKKGMHILLDDGKIYAEIIECNGENAKAKVIRGGILRSRKSILIEEADVEMPVLTNEDHINITDAKDIGITGIMQPFVRSGQDVRDLREALDLSGASHMRIYSKIENRNGIESIKDIIDECDEIIIARGDLGNAIPLWELPCAQKHISSICKDNKKPFMVVTQMLSSMEHSPVPTRAEVSDVFNAILDGASSVMVTGETAVGEYPVETVTYMKKTVDSALYYIESIK